MWPLNGAGAEAASLIAQPLPPARQYYWWYLNFICLATDCGLAFDSMVCWAISNGLVIARRLSFCWVVPAGVASVLASFTKKALDKALRECELIIT